MRFVVMKMHWLLRVSFVDSLLLNPSLPNASIISESILFLRLPEKSLVADQKGRE
ncbi:hypothetical protein MKW92_020595, partial [Papaver armeniacum]